MDKYGFLRPPLDDRSHSWHQGDGDLVRTILNCSSPRPRMMAFGEPVTESEDRKLVAIFKSLWSFRSSDCQIARHICCMDQQPLLRRHRHSRYRQVPVRMASGRSPTLSLRNPPGSS
jgi:hypothetical protein